MKRMGWSFVLSFPLILKFELVGTWEPYEHMRVLFLLAHCSAAALQEK